MIPPDVLRYLEIESARGKKLLPFVRNIFIPISHVLEYREFWEDVDNEYLNMERSDEYGDYQISSIKNAKGMRDYYRQLKYNRDNLVIDLVQDREEKEGDPSNLKLSFVEKFITSRGLRNNNQYLINKSKPYDWGY